MPRRYTQRMKTLFTLFTLLFSFVASGKGKIPVQVGTPPPQFTELPPKAIQGSIGQQLRLQANAENSDPKITKIRIIWVLQNKKVCEGPTCLLPLDGKGITSGVYRMLILAISPTGSAKSFHTLRVLDSPVPVSRLMESVVKPEKAKVQKYNFQSDKVWMRANRGSGFYITTGTPLNYIGRAPQNINWEGIVRGKGRSVLQIHSRNLDWFLLRSSRAVLESGANNGRWLNLKSGHMRFVGKNPEKSLLLQTPEAKIFAKGGIDFYASRLPKLKLKEPEGKDTPPDPFLNKRLRMSSTQITLLSGTATFISALGKETNIPNGLTLTIFSDGSVSRPEKPKPKRVGTVLNLTKTPEQVAWLRQKEEEIKNLDLDELLTETKKLLEGEDYFTALEIIEPLQIRKEEDVRVPLYSGLTYKGLYQLSLAEQNLQVAIKRDPKLYEGHWHLGLMEMEEKKWAEAEKHFNNSAPNIPKDEEESYELHYYRGVTRFQQQKDFSARNDFTRALWANDLSAQLKQSSAQFLGIISDRKPWQFIANQGVGYDSNVLKLNTGDELPTDYPQKSTINSTTALILNWKQLPKNTAGTERELRWGAGAKAIAVMNLVSGFESLNAYVFELNTLQDFTKKKLIFTEQITLIFTGGEPTTLTPALVANWDTLTGTVSYSHDLAYDGTGTDSSSLGLSGEWAPKVPDYKGFVFALSNTVGLTYPFDSASPLSLDLGVAPSATYPFNPRFSVNLATPFGYTIQSGEGAENSGSLATNFGMTYFIQPWLTLGGGPGYAMEFSSSGTANSLTANLSLTGIF